MTARTRPTQPLPEDIRGELGSSARMDDYRARPHYQRNDYLAWIGRAATAATRRKRLDQMLRELETGGTTPRDRRTSVSQPASISPISTKIDASAGYNRA